jgi:hypothetical protein
MKTKLFLVFFIALSAGCKEENDSTPVINQEILFQVEYVNGAWIYQHNGFLIDSSGYVKSYKLPNTWHFVDSLGYISQDDMNDNILQLNTITQKIDKDTLAKYFDLLKYAAGGALTLPKNEMYDAGVTRYCGYIYNAKTEKYRQVMIRQIGDVRIENKSKEAEEIYNWLISLSK